MDSDFLLFNRVKRMNFKCQTYPESITHKITYDIILFVLSAMYVLKPKGNAL